LAVPFLAQANKVLAYASNNWEVGKVEQYARTDILVSVFGEGLAMRSGLALKLLLGISIALIATLSSAQQRTFQPPTVTEVFNLRSKCAALGDKIMEDDFVSSNLSKSNLSHYDPQTNRCYVDSLSWI
jgi:hypothetical protein